MRTRSTPNTPATHRNPSKPSGDPLIAQRCAGCLNPTARAAMMGVYTPKNGRPIQSYYLCKRCATMIGTSTLTAKIEQYLTGDLQEKTT